MGFLGFLLSLVFTVVGFVFIIVFIGIFLLRGKMRTWYRKMDGGRQRPSAAEYAESDRDDDMRRGGGDTVKPHPGKKIFGSDVGEYVDFEEIN